MQLTIFDWGRTLHDPEYGALFPETKEVLEELRAREYMLAIVALATAGERKMQERLRIIEHEQLAPYFASIKFDVANKDRMYEGTLAELGATPEQTTIVDDRVIRGIQWGNAHGCTTVWVQNGKFAHELPDERTGAPDRAVASIALLPAIV